MSLTSVRIIAALLLTALIFGAGWRVRGAFEAERALAIAEAKTEMINTYRAAEAGKAGILEEKLASLRANERTIEREKLQIIDRPVYRNECLDADGLQLVERARAGTGKPDPAKPADEVPRAK